MNLLKKLWLKVEPKLIDQWQCFYKLMTVWIAAAMIAVSTAYEYLPVFQQYLPEGWVRWMAGALILARIIRQSYQPPVATLTETRTETPGEPK